MLRSCSCNPYLLMTSRHTGKHSGGKRGRKSVTISCRDENPPRISVSLKQMNRHDN